MRREKRCFLAIGLLEFAADPRERGEDGRGPSREEVGGQRVEGAVEALARRRLAWRRGARGVEAEIGEREIAAIGRNRRRGDGGSGLRGAGDEERNGKRGETRTGKRTQSAPGDTRLHGATRFPAVTAASAASARSRAIACATTGRG